MKKLNPYAKIFVTAACVSLLMACGGGSDDQDTPASPVDTSITLTGLAMNGYLANALVWVDARDNNTLDGFEPFAYTDNQGYFSYNPNTGVDYCASNNTSLQRFCLQVPTQSGDLILKAAKGVELLSGEAFKSVLSAKVSITQAKQNFEALQSLGPKPSGNFIAWQTQLDSIQTKLSPLSSVAYYLPEDASLALILNQLGYNIPPDLSNADILAKEYIVGLELDDDISDDLFSAAVTLSRLVDVIAVNIDKATESLSFGENGLPISSADAIYAGLAESLLASTTATSNVSNRASFTRQKAYRGGANLPSASNAVLVNGLFPDTAALTASVSNILTILSANNVNTSGLQNTLSTLAQNPNVTSLLENIGNIGSNHFANINPDGDTLNQFLAFNQSVTLPTLTSPIGFVSQQEATAINRVATYLTEPNNRVIEILADAADDLIEQRGDSESLTSSVDLNTLTQDLISIATQSTGEADLASADVAINVTELAVVNTPDDSSFWTGKRLSLSGLQDGDEEGQVLMFFIGDNSAQAGTLIMCVAYRNDADPTDNISSQRFDGTWSVIGGASQNRLSLVSEGFNIQMKVLGESLGSDIPQDQQIVSLPRMANETYGRYGFTLNEDTATWHSDDASVNQSFGLMSSSDIPSNDGECENLLTLQVN